MQAQQMWRESQQLMGLMGRAGLPADVGRYNALILWFKKSKQWAEAMDVLAEMKAAGAKPSIVSFNSVIDACGKARQLKVAFDTFDQVSRQRLSINQVAACALLSSCMHNNWRLHALTPSTRSRGRGWCPTRSPPPR